MSRRWIVLLFAAALIQRICVAVDDEDEDIEIAEDQSTQSAESPPPSIEPQTFETPEPPGHYYFADGFKDEKGLGSRWQLSGAKKEGVDENIAKYNGEWEIGLPEKIVLKNDFGLILKTKARHHAIAARLNKPFEFGPKPLIAQYDINFQNGQECGGAYIKMLTQERNFNLKNFQDKTSYTIMFGPDKCGLNAKLHFIIRYKNPKNGSISEHHAKQPEKSIEGYITDKKSHLYTLVLNPDGAYRIYIDQKEAMRGKLLETMEPPILPAKEIDDPSDSKPEDWDEREKIPDTTAQKPDDWNEDEPAMIDDENAKQPDDWLADEAEYLPDETAQKPNDWDESIDGVWEPPLVKNTKCESVSGCGEWKRPQVKNPAYKGKWKAPLVSNPNYKGKWKPRRIENPDYFEDENPFSSLAAIGAIGLELWSMSEGIIFDNFIITDDKAVADSFASMTWYIKQNAEEKLAAKSSFIGGLVQAANDRPWLWAVYLLVILIPVVLITVFCCTGSKSDDSGHAKKTDAVSPDVPEDEADYESEPGAEGDSETVDAENAANLSQAKKSDLEEDSENDSAAGSEDKPTPQTSPRRRTRKQD